MAEFEVLPVREEDTSEIIRLLERTFFIDEPLNKAIGLCVNSRCTELDEYCTHSLLEGLSFKAVDKEGNIVGAMISGVSPLKESGGEATRHQTAQNGLFQCLFREVRRETWFHSDVLRQIHRHSDGRTAAHSSRSAACGRQGLH